MLERIHRYKRPDNGVLKQNLPQEQYYVMVEDGTERPFSSEYWDSEREGIYGRHNRRTVIFFFR